MQMMKAANENRYLQKKKKQTKTSWRQWHGLIFTIISLVYTDIKISAEWKNKSYVFFDHFV